MQKIKLFLNHLELQASNDQPSSVIPEENQMFCSIVNL
jgi:hypothetical protein